ncbi:MAG: methylase [Oceanospirillaceae bacterium]|nr:methylase [Oceanospirillaceae bacterium]|tara:strand:- start:813 stop:1454 length:642 start_codon:yes stop_codon:yes gene_type:complete
MPTSNLPAEPVLSEELPVAEACLRNRRPILDVLGRYVPEDGFVLEVGSGTGQHGAYMTEHLPGVRWRPTEVRSRLADVRLWHQHTNNPRFLAPLELDVTQDIWPSRDADVVFSANVVHYISWREVECMFRGVQRILKPGGLLILYGPYNYDGQFTSEGNVELDKWLRERNPDSGIKDFEQVMLSARKYDLFLQADEEMPANNRTLVFKKADMV